MKNPNKRSKGALTLLCGLAVVISPPALADPLGSVPCCGLSGTTDGTTVTYSFGGVISNPFGTVAPYTPFSGSFTYAIAQPDLDAGSGGPSWRGSYQYQAFSLTVGSTTVTDNGPGPGRIYVYDHGTYSNIPDPLNPSTYPTDLFMLSSGGASLGSLGGLTLYVISLVLEDTTGTSWSSPALPGSGLTMGNFTHAGNNTILILQSSPQGMFDQPVESTSRLAQCDVPEASTWAAALGLAAVAAGQWHRRRLSP